MNQLPTLSVSELSRLVREVLEGTFPRLLVRGEVSNLSRPQSGHLYFSLVDDTGGAAGSRLSSAQVPCVVWRSSAGRIKAKLENGLKVVVSGRLTVYEARGNYQLIADQVEPAGLGDLQRRFEELKARLRAEGLFEATRKRPLPFLPGKIGLVTSPSGAAIRDVLRVLYHRFPGAWVRLVPVRVQGEGAAGEIAAAVDLLGTPGADVDVILLTRGGGSLEDLWAFNEEVVARAIARSPVPVVSAVGHEVDFTISDFVADLRAQTPTKAAEVLVPSVEELESSLGELRRRLFLALSSQVTVRRQALDRMLRLRCFRQPTARLGDLIERTDDLAQDLNLNLYNRLREWEDSLGGAGARLEALSPLKVLSRGYALVTRDDGSTVKDAARLNPGDQLTARFARGLAKVEVRSVET